MTALTLECGGREVCRDPNSKGSESGAGPPHSKAVPKARPLFLRPQPAAVQAVSVFPEGPPIRFQWDGGEYAVARCRGPERIETGWWQERHVRRDYYLVETGDGRWFWLFRERESGAWFLHGEF